MCLRAARASRSRARPDAGARTGWQIALVSLTLTPDGRGLTYADVMSENAWVIPIDGGPPRQLTAFTADKQITSGAWSSDGKQFAIARSVTTSDIVLLKGVR